MAHDHDATAALLQRSLFRDLGPDARRAVSYALRDVRLQPGDVLFREGDAGEEAYLVMAGEIEIVGRVADGSEAVRAVIGPGELFGELALFGGGRRTAAARARGAVTLGALRYEPFAEILRAWPDAALALLRQLTRRFVDVERQQRATLRRR